MCHLKTEIKYIYQDLYVFAKINSHSIIQRWDSGIITDDGALGLSDHYRCGSAGTQGSLSCTCWWVGMPVLFDSLPLIGEEVILLGTLHLKIAACVKRQDIC